MVFGGVSRVRENRRIDMIWILYGFFVNDIQWLIYPVVGQFVTFRPLGMVDWNCFILFQ